MQARKHKQVRPHDGKPDARHEERTRTHQAVHRVPAQASGFRIDTFQGARRDGDCISPKRQYAGQRMLYLSSRGMLGSGREKGPPGKGTSTRDCGAAKTGIADRVRTEEVTG